MTSIGEKEEAISPGDDVILNMNIGPSQNSDDEKVMINN